MMLETHMKLSLTEPDFLGKPFFPKNLRKWAKNSPKTGVFLNIF